MLALADLQSEQDHVHGMRYSPYQLTLILNQIQSFLSRCAVRSYVSLSNNGYIHSIRTIFHGMSTNPTHDKRNRTWFDNARICLEFAYYAMRRTIDVEPLSS